MNVAINPAHAEVVAVNVDVSDPGDAFTSWLALKTLPIEKSVRSSVNGEETALGVTDAEPSPHTAIPAALAVMDGFGFAPD